MELTHISLFAGIGGIDLAAEWVGFRTVLFVEIDPFCQKVLRKHWSDVPIIGNIKDVTKEKVMAYAQSNGFRQGRTASSDEIQQENKAPMPQISSRGKYGSRATNRPINPVTLITGGFPCQPVSVAGKRKGTADDRWLWPEMLRVIREVRPTWVVAENVAGLLRMGFNDCVSDLESEGYETISFLIPACAVNAPHRRDRIFIVAHTELQRCDSREYRLSGRQDTTERQDKEENQQDRGEQRLGIGKASEDAADTILRTKGTAHRKGSNKRGADSKQDNRNSLGNDIRDSSKAIANTTEQRPYSEENESILERAGSCKLYSGKSRDYGSDWWATEPELGRVAYGIPHRVDRLKALGNAVVPQQIYPILLAIAKIERKLADGG